MPDLGFRDNVMGPQPIAKKKPVPQDLLDTVAQILDLLIEGNATGLTTLATASAKDETARLASAVKAGSYNDKIVIATARTNDHYWIKAKLTGPDTKPFVLQLRMGLDRGKWLIWEAMNLSDMRSAWTR
ncbi:MAG TPA: hypothetical protein VN867_14940 [Candidatus Binataceae bacterium]|jgi:hypothetical protein|nr:hypothetical protein [Candidatus Binataceae bacterium]